MIQIGRILGVALDIYDAIKQERAKVERDWAWKKAEKEREIQELWTEARSLRTDTEILMDEFDALQDKIDQAKADIEALRKASVYSPNNGDGTVVC
jgi:predicted  nucleic acid-binding Zn-ribbon protein